jgi:hypothetical protein
MIETYGGVKFEAVYKGTFEEVYEKQFLKFVGSINKFDMISKDTNKIVIAMSGGKDCQLMTTFLSEYKKRIRPDLELELITVPLPGWKYFPGDFIDVYPDESHKELLKEQKKLIDTNVKYWKERGIPTVNVKRVAGIDDQKIMDSTNPCTWCYIATKKSFFKYLLENDNDKNVRFSIGLTKWDSLYVLVSRMLAGQNWEVLKKQSKELYDFNRLHVASFSPHPKLNIGLPNKTVYQIQPLVEFNDFETKALASKMEFPLIPDICQDLHGSKFQSDKRHFDRFLKTTAVETMNIGAFENPLFSDYENLLKVFNHAGVLPPLEDLNNILYSGYKEELFASAITDGK